MSASPFVDMQFDAHQPPMGMYSLLDTTFDNAPGENLDGRHEAEHMSHRIDRAFFVPEPVWVYLDEWLMQTYRLPEDETVQSAFLNPLFQIADAQIDEEHQHIFRVCIESHLPALLAISLMTTKLSPSGEHSAFARSIVDCDESRGLRFRVDCCTFANEGSEQRDVVCFLAFCAAVVWEQITYPTVECLRVLRWAIAAPWFRDFSRGTSIFDLTPIIACPIPNGEFRRFFSILFKHCVLLNTSVPWRSDSTSLSNCRYKDNVSLDTVARFSLVRISFCFAADSALTRMCLFACYSAMPGARLPITSRNLASNSWKSVMESTVPGTFRVAAFNPMLCAGILYADVYICRPTRCMMTPVWLEEGVFDSNGVNVFQWITFQPPDPTPPTPLRPFALRGSLLRPRRQALRSSSSSEEAARNQAVRAYGFPVNTPLVVEQCKAVYEILQAAHPQTLDCLLLGSIGSAMPSGESVVWSKLPPATPLLVRERSAEGTASTVSPMTLAELQMSVEAERSSLRFLLRLATGSGKTLLALTLLCHTLGERGLQGDQPVVVVVPTLVLAHQMVSSIRCFTTLDALILADKNVSPDPIHSLDMYAKGRCRKSEHILAHLAQLKKVLVLVSGYVCSTVLNPWASLHPWFLILDEVQELIARPRRDTYKAGKLQPLLYMRQLLTHAFEATHLLLLSATPEVVLTEIAALLTPGPIYALRRFSAVQRAFLDRHTCSQVVPPRRTYRWTHELLVTSSAPHQYLYDQLRDTQLHFESKDHDEDNLRLVVSILHRCGQRVDVRLHENLTTLVLQLLAAPRRDASRPLPMSCSFQACSPQLNAFLRSWTLDVPSRSTCSLALSTEAAHASSLEDLHCPVCFEALVQTNSVQLTCTHLLCMRCFVEWARCQLHRASPLCPLDNQPILDISQPCFSGPVPPLRPSVTQNVSSVSVDYQEVKAQARELLQGPLVIPLASPIPNMSSRKRASTELSDTRDEDAEARSSSDGALLPKPFTVHSKATALLATLSKYAGRRSLLFCCPEELAYYETTAQSAGWLTTRCVDEFQREPQIGMILLPHAQATGTNLAEASLLIRISIDSCDPGQAVQQRGRLTRHTQTQDLIEVVIVSPGWEYMLLQLQRQAGIDVKTAHYQPPSVRQLCTSLFHWLRVGHRLGLRPLYTPTTGALVANSDPLFPVIQLIDQLGFQLHRDVTLSFLVRNHVLLHRYQEESVQSVALLTDALNGVPVGRKVASSASFNIRTGHFQLHQVPHVRKLTLRGLVYLANGSCVACVTSVAPPPVALEPQLCCAQAIQWLTKRLFVSGEHQ
jgi:hypothetical protein